MLVAENSDILEHMKKSALPYILSFKKRTYPGKRGGVVTLQ
jgi:hypothetical protein